MDDNLFTNETEIKYPSLEDTIDVRVLNNNTKLLSEKKIDFSELDNISRESSNYAIETKVDNIDTKVNSLATSSALATVSNKIDNLGSGEEKQKWWTLPNIYTRKLFTYTTLTGIYHYRVNLFKLYNPGKLISISAPFLVTLPPNVNAIVEWRLLLDDISVLWNNINIVGSELTTEDFYVGFGIHNIQSGCPFNEYSSNHNVSNILALTDETGTKTESSLNYSYYDHTYLNTSLNSFPNFHTNVNTNHIHRLDYGSIYTQDHTISIYNQKSTFGYPQANSFMYFYDDTCLEFKNNLTLQFRLYSTDWSTNIAGANHGAVSITLAE